MRATGEVLDDYRDLPDSGRRAVEDVIARQPHSGRSATAARSAAQAWLIYDRLFRIGARFGVGRDGFLKTTVYLADMDDFAAVEAVAGHFFPHDPPALTRAATIRPVDAGCPRSDRRGAAELRLV